MLPDEISTTDLLDILFENKNKAYGAYVLRKEYNRRMKIALLITGVLLMFFLAYYYFLTSARDHLVNRKIPTDNTLIKLIDPPPPQPELPPPPPPPPPAEKISMKQYTNVVIVKDASADETPPEIKDLENSKIGTITQAGIEDPMITAPPVSDTRGITAVPKHNADDDDDDFVPIQIESSFPGGPQAWQRFLIKAVRYPQPAQENLIQGPVTVRFVVDKDGNVSNVEALSGPIELKDEAVRVITGSGKWNPAIQNGRPVKSWKTQVIVFRLGDE